MKLEQKETKPKFSLRIGVGDIKKNTKSSFVIGINFHLFGWR
jgi:hypothetical protein